MKKTNLEFSNEFDTLANSFALGEIIGLQLSPLKFDEYEKSVFLTKALELIVINLYNGNLIGDSFEKTEELRRYLSTLVKTYKTSIQDKLYRIGLSSKSVFFHLPEDVLFITYESIKLNDDSLGCMKDYTIEVTPITQDDYHKIKENPFKQPNKRRALRLDVDGDTVEIISNYDVASYTVRYVAKPTPIVLMDLPEGLSIEGCSNETECELNPAIHRIILELAVQLALLSRAGKS